MLISCPKCSSVYNLADSYVPESGKKFKCAECGNIWVVYPRDLKDVIPENKIIRQKIRWMVRKSYINRVSDHTESSDTLTVDANTRRGSLTSDSA